MSLCSSPSFLVESEAYGQGSHFVNDACSWTVFSASCCCSASSETRESLEDWRSEAIASLTCSDKGRSLFGLPASFVDHSAVPAALSIFLAINIRFFSGS